MLRNLDKYHILLASKSPRRRELLSLLRIPFNVISLGNIKEDYPADLPVEEIPLYLSDLKANAYMSRIKDNEMIITADTLVILGNKVLGKPKDAVEAVDMLLELSEHTHHVITGVTIATLDKRSSFSCCTEVKFGRIERKEAEYYVNTFRPLDKAGAYGIQEWIGCIAVESINGSFYNVMGLPIHRLFKELKNF